MFDSLDENDTRGKIFHRTLFFDFFNNRVFYIFIDDFKKDDKLNISYLKPKKIFHFLCIFTFIKMRSEHLLDNHSATDLQIKPIKLSARRTHHDLQNIPEQQRDARKKRKRRGDVLVGAILVQNVRRIIKNRAAGKRDHQKSKQIADAETEQKTRHDKAEREKKADCQNGREKRKILARYKNDRR